MNNNFNNYQDYDEGLLRVEKKSTNKVGIFIVVILFLALVAASGYYFYRNGISLDFSLPWQTDKSKSENNKNAQGQSGSKTKNQYDDPKFDDTKFSGSYDYDITFTNFRKVKLGYDMDITITNSTVPYSFTLEKILVDGYDTSASFTQKLEPHQSVTETVRINQTELDALDITAFSELTFYIKTVDANGKEKIEDETILSKALKKANNARVGLIEIDRKNQTIVNYYKTQEDKDNTYIYFDFKNYSAGRIQLISVKKLKINGQIYEYKDLNETVYHGAEKVISLTIPKKDFKKVENFSISFTMLNEINDKKTAAYITNEYSRTV